MKLGKLKFIPLLVFYIIIVLAASTDTFWGDEGRYVMFATNLSHGFYSPSDNIYLWNGPGYPLVLLPFLVAKLPWLAAKLFNALFLFGAVLYFYDTLRLYVTDKHALVFAYIFGSYPPFMKQIHLLLTETLVIFLVCGFLFHFCKYFKDNMTSWIQLLISSFYLGYLALTKIFFGYVILSGLLLFLFLYIWLRKDVFKKTFLVYLFALICCLPYLFYTYTLTGKIFYWGNSGGLSLYWMSTPYEKELGDWIWTENVYSNPELLQRHGEFYSTLESLSSIQRDEELKKQAIQNIINHPFKYFKNWLANVGRLLFNYPYSYNSQKLSTYFYLIPNMFLVVAFVFCLYPAYIGRKLIPYEVYALFVFCMISFTGSTIVSAYNRQFQSLMPVFLLWISFILVRIVRVEIRQ